MRRNYDNELLILSSKKSLIEKYSLFIGKITSLENTTNE